MPTQSLNSNMGVSSSLEGIFISPRTPVARSPRPPQNGGADSEEVELSLLGEAERRQAATGLDGEDDVGYTSKRPVSSKDKRAMVLLCVLCKSFILVGVRIVQHFSRQTLFKAFQ
jgi:MFS transporter, PAT family, solute carrier family 33 (acetyl-CoA transportor), member 1